MILDKIINQTKIDLDKIKSVLPFEKLINTFEKRNIVDVKKVLKKDINSDTYNIICEIKKASPSKGIIKEDFNPIDIAKSYDKAGGVCMSILTEEHFFQGSLEYLKEVREVTKVPLLRKDFIIDKYQVAQAYINGADMLLLIAKVLSKGELKELLDYTYALGLEALVEVHDRDDLEKSLDIGANIIGINHRNLDDFSMNMNLSEELKQYIPNDKIIIAESGIDTKDTLARLDSVGVDAFLIGEHFMRAENIEKYVKSFIRKIK
jgi:indole-3-glycerol phosphate synthase